MKITFEFRFPVKQAGPTTVVIPMDGPGPSVINPAFAEQFDLDDAERTKATEAAVRAIAIVKPE